MHRGRGRPLRQRGECQRQFRGVRKQNNPNRFPRTLAVIFLDEIFQFSKRGASELFAFVAHVTEKLPFSCANVHILQKNNSRVSRHKLTERQRVLDLKN